MSFKRADKVSEAIKREISIMLTQDVKDPGIHFATVTSVVTTDDLRDAKIYISIFGDDETRKESMAGLERAKGFMRHEIGQRLKLRYTPNLHFYLDTSLDHAVKIRTILKKIKGEEKSKDEDQDQTED